MLPKIIPNSKEVFENQNNYSSTWSLLAANKIKHMVVWIVEHNLCNRWTRLPEPTVYQLVDKTFAET
jgi:hypothetical protein